MRQLRVVLILSTTAVIVGLIACGSAHAHERRTIGPYQFVVGWEVEPAFVEQKNGISLRVTKAPASAGGQESPGAGAVAPEPEPIVGLEKTLKAEIIFGGQRRTITLRGVFRQPGRYTTDIVPTSVGDYRFRFFGSIGTMNVDETFDSADGKFDGVEGTEAIYFPAKLPLMAEVAAQAQRAEQAAAAAQAGVGTARTLGTLALLAGALGIVLGIVAAVAIMRPRPAG